MVNLQGIIMTILAISEPIYQKMIYNPKDNEKIINNSAYCIKCDSSLVSKDPLDLVICKCFNLKITGGLHRLEHRYVNKLFYDSRSIILIDE